MAVISKSTILIDRKYLSTILIDRKYLFNYIDQSNYCIIEVFNHAFLKNNIETRDGCKFDKIVREISCENFNRLVNTCIKYQQ